MRLKTKFQDEDFDLGEVVEANVYYGGSGRIKVIAEPVRGGMITFYFETLKGLNKMFEDVPEEPKEYWCITGRGNLHYLQDMTDENDKDHREIGNYFSSQEEAEKAVRKLKAWKRLKDKGFRFDGYDVAHNSNGDLCGQLFYNAGDYCIEDGEKDLDLLFCPEAKNE